MTRGRPGQYQALCSQNTMSCSRRKTWPSRVYRRKSTRRRDGSLQPEVGVLFVPTMDDPATVMGKEKAKVPFVAMAASHSEPMVARVLEKDRPMAGQTPVELSHIPYRRLQSMLHWWKLHAPPSVCQMIVEGIMPQWSVAPTCSVQCQRKSQEEIAQVKEILQRYQAVGAVRQVPWQGTKHLVPWFVIAKQEKESQKLRLISD